MLYCVIPIVPSQLREFSEVDLEQMTEGYSTTIGQGSFGTVYKGVCDHIPVAVKVINLVSWWFFMH